MIHMLSGFPGVSFSSGTDTLFINLLLKETLAAQPGEGKPTATPQHAGSIYPLDTLRKSAGYEL